MINKNLMESESIENMAEYFDSRVEGYDDVHHQHNISWGIEIRDIVAKYIPKDGLKILDLGAGTGIELEEILKNFPNSKVTCIDISPLMLQKLKLKFPQDNVVARCENFLDCEFGEEYDVVISVMALHHFLYNEKKALYAKIYKALKKGGMFINSDYIVNTKQEEETFTKNYLKVIKRSDELVHFDIPMCLETETEILKDVGFNQIAKVFENAKTKVIISKN